MVILTSNTNQIWFLTGLCLDLLDELTACPRPPSWVKWLKCMVWRRERWRDEEEKAQIFVSRTAPADNLGRTFVRLRCTFKDTSLSFLSLTSFQKHLKTCTSAKLRSTFDIKHSKTSPITVANKMYQTLCYSGQKQSSDVIFLLPVTRSSTPNLHSLSLKINVFSMLTIRYVKLTISAQKHWRPCTTVLPGCERRRIWFHFRFGAKCRQTCTAWIYRQILCGRI